MKAGDKFSLVILSASAGLLVSLSFSAGLFFGLENFFEDRLFSEKAVSDKIVILAIDDESIAKIGQWPWPRSVFARAVNNLKADRPAALGIDVIFAEPSRFGAADDQKLSDALESADFPIILPVEADPLNINTDGKIFADNFLKTLSKFAGGKTIELGHVNLLPDPDGIVRKFPASIGGFRSFPVLTAEKSGYFSSGISGINRIAFSAAPNTVRRISFWRILEDKGLDLSGKILLAGATASDLHDEKLTPTSRGVEMPGVEIQANIVNMLLMNYRVNQAPKLMMIIWILISSFIPALLFIYSKNILSAVSGGAILIILNILAVTVLSGSGILANLVHLVLSTLLSSAAGFGYRYLIIEKDRRGIKNVFSKYVSKDILEEILKSPEKVALGGEEKEITVFFSDIRGFTTLSEKTTPKELVRILNRYFTLMTDKVLKNGGVLDKYIGDAIMAFWGAPIHNPNQADDALRASIQMLSELKKLNKELKAAGDPEIGIGIGLYTGPAIVGNVGSDLRFDYTVIGDTVNVASRLEGLNKEYGTQIIIGETTKNNLKGDYKIRPLGSVAVKGRKEPLNIYSVEI